MRLLFRRDDDGRYRDAGAVTGLTAVRTPVDTFYSSPLMVVDVDEDGDEDVYLTQGSAVITSLAADRNAVRHVVAVHVLQGTGSVTAAGATVRVEAATGAPHPWVSVRVVGTSSAAAPVNPVVHVGLPRWAVGAGAGAAFNITVTWPDASVSATSAATHPLLYGWQPSTHTTHKVVVRPASAAVQFSLQEPPPWDTHTLGAVPTIGEELTLRLQCSHCAARDFSLVSANVNGRDVLSTFRDMAGGASQPQYAVVYTVPPSDVYWPWTGLSVHVVLLDSAGLVSTVDVDNLVVGAKLYDVDNASPAADRTLANGVCVCVGDVDSSGSQDVFVGAKLSFENKLFLTTPLPGGPVFENVALAWNVTAPDVDATQCLLADFDGSGRPWLALASSGVSPLRLYRNTGFGFVEDGAAHGVTVVGSLRDLAAADFDADGDLVR